VPTATPATTGILRLRAVVEALRDSLDNEMPLQVVQCLLIVSLEPGISTTDVAARAGISLGAASRNLGILGEYARGRKGPHNLIVQDEDPSDRRFLRTRLTKRGADLMKQINATILGAAAQ